MVAKRRRDAIASYREAIEAWRNPLLRNSSTTWAQVGAAAARCAELMGEENAGDTVESKIEREKLVELAMDQLRRSVDAGVITNPRYLSTNPALKILREREDFKALQAKMKTIDQTAVTTANDGHLSEISGASKSIAAANAPVDEAIRLRGDIAAAHYALGIVHLQLGDRDEARKLLESTLKERSALVRDQPKTSRHKCDLGMTLYALGDLAGVAKDYPEALRQWVASRDVLIPLASDSTVEPAVSAEAAQKLFGFAEWADGRGLGVVVRECLKSTIENEFKPISSAPLVMYGRNSLLVGDLEEYRRSCRRMSQLYANDKERAAYDADMAILYGLTPDSGIDPELALRAGKAALRLDHSGLADWPRGYLAIVSYRAGRYAEALSLIDQVDESILGLGGDQAPFSTHTRVLRAMVLHKLRRVDEAGKILTEARADRDRVGMQIFWQSSPTAHLDQWGWGYLRVLLREAALLIDGDSNRDEPWNDLYEAWAEAGYGRPELARAALGRMGSISDGDAALHAARGRVFTLLGDTDKARIDIGIALRLDPGNLLARLERGLAALKEERPEDAANDLVAALSQFPVNSHPDAVRNVPEGWLVSSDAAFRRAVELSRDDPQLWVARGQYLACQSRWKESAVAYARGVETRQISHDWVEYACVLILSDDLVGYRDFCGREAKRVATPDGLKGGMDDEAYTRALAVRIACLHPGSGDGAGMG